MTKELSRGYRNNNPLNIRYSTANNWLGKILPNTDGVFEQFVSMDYGYRAALYLIRKYINKGYATVGDIISRWAPTNENNTQAYINSVCNQTGFTPFTRISFDRKADVIKLAAAMSVHENGNIPGYPDQAAIENGYNMLQTTQQSSYRTIGMLTIAVVAIFAAGILINN